MYKRHSWAKKPPLNLASEKILLARRERGKDAQGDLLLHAALKAIRSKHTESVQRNLKDFLLLTQDLSPFDRSLVEDARSIAEQSRRWTKVVRFLLSLFPLFCELLLRLMSKKFPGCIYGHAGRLA